MALIAMTTADTVEYVSDLDPEKKVDWVLIDETDISKGKKRVETIGDDATIFKLRPLDVFLMGWIYDNASVLRGVQGSAEIGIHTKVNSTNIQAVRFGLAGVSNFKDAHGNAVKLKTVKDVINGRQYDAVEDYVMNQMDIQLITDLATKIKSISEVQKSEEKKSVEVLSPSV